MATGNPSARTYPLYPWYYLGGDLSIEPDAEAALEVGGRTRHFLLKVHERRVYFRRVDRRQQQWALTELLPEPETDLADFWREQVGQGNFGSYHVVTRGYNGVPTPQMYTEHWGERWDLRRGRWDQYLLRDSPVAVIVLVDGSGCVREWCGREWFPMPPCLELMANSTRDLWRRGPGLDGLRRHLGVMTWPLALRRMTEADLESQEVTWVRGSPAELVELITLWYVAANLETHLPDSLQLYASLPFSTPDRSVGYANPADRLDFLQFYLRKAPQPEISPWLLLPIFEWNRAVGITWYGKPGAPRCDCYAPYWGQRIILDFPTVPKSTPLSRLEAKTKLVHWFENKISANLLEVLLSPEGLDERYKIRARLKPQFR